MLTALEWQNTSEGRRASAGLAKQEADAKAREAEAARAKVEAARSAAFKVLRDDALAAVEHATHRPPTVEQRMYSEHFASLCAAAPTIRARWLRPGTWTGVRNTNGLAAITARTLLIWPLVDRLRYTTSIHEVGHCRRGLHGSVLVDEISAWSFAVRHAIVWDRTTDQLFGESIRSYISEAERKKRPYRALHLDLAQQLKALSERTHRPLFRALEKFQAGEFVELYGERKCMGHLCGRRAPAVRYDEIDERAYCTMCSDARTTDRQAEQLRRYRRTS